jgi:UDP-glucose 4-epimerase
MKRCLVIGGNGFVGSHVVDQLVRQGHEVGVYDRFSSDVNRFESAGVRRHIGDFLDAEGIGRAVRNYQVVYHLMTTTTPATATSDPLLDIRTNVVGSVDLLRAAAKAGIEHFYFASSGGTIYGTVPDRPAREDDPTVPISPYGIGKLTIERYLDFYRVTTGMQTTSFRISNAFGTRQNPLRPQGVIPIFLRSVLEGRPIQVLGDGSMSRDYIYVEDVARAMVRPLSGEHMHDAYNIGSGVATTVNEVVELIRDITRREFDTIHTPAPSTFVDRVVLDTSRYRADFGDFMNVGLRDGIARTWEALSRR